MQNAQVLQDRVATINAESERCADFRDVKAQHFVGEHPEPMSDSEREDAIVRAGNAMQAWYQRYQSSGDPRALDIAYRMLGNQKALIEGRSAEQVRRMEEARGLR